MSKVSDSQDTFTFHISCVPSGMKKIFLYLLKSLLEFVRL